jgi:hypothetical protein
MRPRSAFFPVNVNAPEPVNGFSNGQGESALASAVSSERNGFVRRWSEGCVSLGAAKSDTGFDGPEPTARSCAANG